MRNAVHDTMSCRPRSMVIRTGLAAVACVLCLLQSAAASSESSAASVPQQPATSAVEPELVTFTAADGVVVSADFYAAADAAKAPFILLFHQAGSNAGEYVPIAPRLVARGWNALAVDARAGASMWGRSNRTVIRLGRTEDFLRAYADLEAALAWALARGATRVVAWGSSYSAALVLRLAAEHREVAAVLAFSPGEYLGPGEPVRGWAAQIAVPVFVTSATGQEVEAAARILAAVPGSDKFQFAAGNGVHGSSTLRADRNPAGAEQNWASVEAFLEHVRP